MSWLALLLVGVGCTDIAHSVRHRRFLPGTSGALAVLVVGLLAGLTGWPDLAAVVVLAAFAFGWELVVTRGFGRRQPWLPLVVLGAGFAAAVLLSGQAGQVGGPFADWLAQVPLPVLRDLQPDDALLLAGVVLVQLSTGNVIVRLVLATTGTISPDAQGALQGPERRLKGGRLLGPLERLFILGFGLAGQFTAAAVVVAAKGLLRWPELSSRMEQERVHRLTEYFLVGSFVSWVVALSGLTLTGLVPTG